MIGICIAIVLVLTAALSAGLYIYFRNKKQKALQESKLAILVESVLNSKSFLFDKYLIINGVYCIAIHRKGNRIAILRNLKIDKYGTFDYDFEYATVQLIKSIQRISNTINLIYMQGGQEKNILISNPDSETKEFIHELYLKSCISYAKEKYEDFNFNLVAGSDLEVSYFWAFDSFLYKFIYMDTANKKSIRDFNILKENITIDTKYNYFEAPIMGIVQQLFVYEKDFLSDLFFALLKKIKSRYVAILKDKIYFDNINEIIYLTNNMHSYQSIIYNRIRDVKYSAGRISFYLKNSERVINFFADEKMIFEFNEFVISKNIKRVMEHFDYSVDKLVNPTDNTKFFIDYTKKRIVYCANVDTISRFNYIIYYFDSILNVEFEKRGKKPFVRIHCAQNETLDVTCNRSEIAEYIYTLIKLILNGKN